MPQADTELGRDLAVQGCAVAKLLRFFGTVYGVGDLVYLHNQVYEIKVCIQIDRAPPVSADGLDTLEQWSFVSQPTSVGSRWRRGGEASILILDETIQPCLRLVQGWAFEDESCVLVLG